MEVQSVFVRIHEERGLSARAAGLSVGAGGFPLGRFLVVFLFA